MDFFVVDAFTDRPFGGNPAAVVLLSEPRDDAWLQAVAAEFNLSETAFVDLTGDHHDESLPLRWFTPATEVDLCGHATLAAAHVLGGEGRFHTRSGRLDCAAVAGGWIEMTLPADPPAARPLPEGIGLPRVEWAGAGRFDAVAVLQDAAAVRDLVPDLAGLASVGTRSVVVTAPGDRQGVDMVSRVFGPNVGIPEDPVTGSAHCMLAELWGERFGRSELVGEQASARGGTVRMRRAGAHVVVSGQAVTVGRTVLRW